MARKEIGLTDLCDIAYSSSVERVPFSAQKTECAGGQASVRARNRDSGKRRVTHRVNRHSVTYSKCIIFVFISTSACWMFNDAIEWLTCALTYK